MNSLIRIDKISVITGGHFDVIAHLSYAFGGDERRRDDLAIRVYRGEMKGVSVEIIVDWTRDQLRDLQTHLGIFDIFDETAFGAAAEATDYLGSDVQELNTIILYDRETNGTDGDVPKTI